MSKPAGMPAAGVYENSRYPVIARAEFVLGQTSSTFAQDAG
jgi:hypothetical protein